MPVKPLPSRPSLEHLKYQAKDLMKDHAARSLGAAQRVREFHPKFIGATDAEIFARPLKVSDAQLTIARERGFSSWARLKRHIEQPTQADRLELKHHERIEDATFRRAVELIDSGDVTSLRELLKRHPELVRQRVVFEGGNYFRNPALLEFVAENPVRNGMLPKNIVEVARVILDSGAEQASRDETLMLVATGRVPRECAVQTPLIELLCEYGADADKAIVPAAFNGESGAVKELLRCGARLSLPVAAASGMEEAFLGLLKRATAEERHTALAMGAQFGRVAVVRMLLGAGEDPNRYNPVGGHSHSTPLHQAALAGNLEMVKLLLEHGAKADIRDLTWDGTPADWAKHARQSDVETYLRKREGSSGKDR